MKKLIFFVTILSTLLFGCVALAADTVTEAPDIRIQIDGVTGTYTLSPITVHDRTMLPLREILVKLGVPNDDTHILWNGDLNTVTIVNGDTHLGLTVGSTTAIVNGDPVTLDAAPLLYRDRVFIPARFVAQSLGKHVDWDSDSQTVRILSVQPGKQKTVRVSTTDEFLSAIAPDTRIILAPGVYNLSEATPKAVLQPGVTFEKVTDGLELNLEGISNLTLEGSEGLSSGKISEIRVNPRYAAVLHLSNCTGFTLSNIKAGHTPEPYHCNAGVVETENCNQLTIRDSELYGCGSVGLSASGSAGISMNNTLIDHCSLRAMWLNNCIGVNISNSRFENNEAYADILSLTHSTRVIFDNCRIAGNHAMTWSVVSAQSGSDVTFRGCTFEDNVQPEGTSAMACIFFNNKDYNGKFSAVNVEKCVFTGNQTDYFGYDNTWLVLNHNTGENNSFTFGK